MTLDLRRNNLGEAASPYLRQHRDNPVWWQEWTEPALEAAAALGKPLFVSVGYSTCHWCHVMAAEAFTDPDTAAFLNTHFVCVKVDRETRPDIDQLLMRFAYEQNGQGGWPLNVFLTPDRRPVFALTYAPARDRGGLASLRRVAAEVLDYIRRQGERVRPFRPAERGPDRILPDDLPDELLAALDPLYGGFGAGPKFPPHSTLLFMLYRLCAEPHAGLEQACRLTLDAMRRGGLQDHLQGGFFRYCVDRAWTIPHFEKMLYDQALALWTYALAFKVLGDEAYRRTALGVVRCLEETFAMDGLFATAYDADTRHREGETYVWSLDEIRAALEEEEFRLFSASYRLPETGNFHGAIHLTRADDRPLPAVEAKLLARRRQRLQPDRDDKILCGLNALAACALTQASRLMDRLEWEARAAAIVRRLLELFWDGRRLAHGLAFDALQEQEFLGDAAALLLALTLLREEDDEWAAPMKALAGRVASFHRGGRWLESENADFGAVEASWFDHPVPSSPALAVLGTARADVLNEEPPGPLEYLRPHQADFFNVAVLFTRGLFHHVHSPNGIPWSRLPAHVIQVRGGPEADCYMGACRPLSEVLGAPGGGRQNPGSD